VAGAQTVAPSSRMINKHHTGPTGKPCLDLFGQGKPQLVNHDIFDHVVSASNSCGQHIKVQVCYYKSEHCIMMDVPAYQRKDAVLGVFPKQVDFQFEYKEQF
jgi:hypothetical protein